MSSLFTFRSRALALLLAFAGACGSNGASHPDAGSAAPKRAFKIVLEHLDGALMSVAGTASDDVWAVGANTNDGQGALALHYDGSSWQRMTTGVDANLWWAHVFATDSIYFGGSSGTILHYDGQQFTKQTTPRSGLVYGVWGAADDDIWAVGGEPDAEPGFIWHFDGTSWSDMTSMLPDAIAGKSLFKVWGRTANDVWIVGLDGVAVHWDGNAFTQANTGTDQRLFTVHGTAQGKPAYVAVGGDASPVLVQNDGTAWHTLAHNPAPTQLFGVFMQNDKLGYAVGYDGIVLGYDGAAWKLLDTGLELSFPLHSVWVDPDGGVWAVGGDLDTAAPDEGMLVNSGKTVSNAINP